MAVHFVTSVSQEIVIFYESHTEFLYGNVGIMWLCKMTGTVRRKKIAKIIREDESG